MTAQRRNELNTTLRYLVTKYWGDPKAQAQALEVCDELVGYPRPGEKAAAPEPLQPGKIDHLIGQLKELKRGGFKVALVVGHNAKQPGAWVEGDLNESEYVFNNQVADQIIFDGLEGVQFRRFNRRYSGSYYREITEVYESVNAWKPDLIVELHFNGGGGDYVCCLAAEVSPVSQAMAKVFADTFAAELGFKNKGVFARGRRERGGQTLYAGKAPTVLTEPFFGDYVKHANKISNLRHKGVADIYRLATARALAQLVA